MNAKKILNLCDQWRSSVIQPDGRCVHSQESKKLTLLVQGCVFSAIDVDAMQATCVGLTDRLHYKNSGQYIDHDISEFWQWAAKIFSTDAAKGVIGEDIQSHLLDLVFPALFSEEDPFLNPEYLEMVYGRQTQQERFNHFVEKLVASKERLLAHLAFPLLEAVARKRCSAYIAANGVVVSAFSIGGRSYNRGQRCSSLKHVLIFAEQLSDNSFVEWHRRLGTVIHRIAPGKSLYSAIYEWRNQLLHGNEFLATKNRIILNIALVFLLEICRSDYETIRQSCLNSS